MNNIELSDKERNDLFKIITNKDEDGYGQDELRLDYEYINELLNDRFNKGKEEGINYMKEKLCTKCGRFHSEGDMCEELLPF